VPEPSAALVEGLNPAQQEAVATVDGPLLVVAGAGSGKTRVLTHRIAHLIRDHGVSPFELLAITFTNRAAGEMAERVGGLVGQRLSDRMWVTTFHKACVRILRREASRLGYRSGFTIYDQADAQRLIAILAKELGIDDKRLAPRAIHAAISNAKDELVDFETYRAQASGWPESEIAAVYEAYQQRLVRANALDFDDLIVKTVELFQLFDGVLEHYQQRFRYLLVDEYQDTNRAQYHLVNLLAASHRNLMVVGDPQQGVYSFRGATIRNILDFERDHPDARVVVLDRNYRSTQTILDAANRVIAPSAVTRRAELWTDRGPGERVVRYHAEDEHDEAAFVAEECERLRTQGYTSTTSRSSTGPTPSRACSRTCSSGSGCPTGSSAGCASTSGARSRTCSPTPGCSSTPTTTCPPGGSSTSRVEASASGPRRRSTCTPGARASRSWRPAGRPSTWPGSPPGRSARSARSSTCSTCCAPSSSTTSPPPTCSSASPTAPATCASCRPSARSRRSGREENLRELGSVAQEVHERNGGVTGVEGLEAFLESVTLVSDQDELDDDEEGTVTLMTLHTAKGLEFPVVFLVGLEDGVFPHVRSLGEPEQLEEERRLCYVGFTRAQDRLYVSHAEHRTLWGGASYNPPSRFLDDLPAELVDERRPARGASAGRRVRDAEVIEIGGAEFRIGDRVLHATFGAGQVTELAGEGERAEATVVFDDGVTKHLVLAYAPLVRAG
jgi:DNA helicase II / ATP-dependent DNA helicase PcrA